LEEAHALASVPGWGRMTAVRTGRVYAVDGSVYLNRSGPRLVDSLEILAHLLHPNLIAAPPDATTGWRLVP
jgi:iron complex transport system substrate-binding protein